MALSLDTIALPREPLVLTPIGALGPAHSLSASKIRMLTRYFGLDSVALSAAAHPGMCGDPLAALIARHPNLTSSSGLLIYAKTQTHNTFAESGWLAALAREVGLIRWEPFTISMNHCASGLAVFDFIHRMAERRPVIVLTGEKCFHASTCRQSSAALGELPAATLLNHESGTWRVANTRLTHIPRFYSNPDRMDPADLRDFERNFGVFLMDFLGETLADFAVDADEVDLVVPYNLNLPLLARIAEAFQWQDRTYTDAAARIGHLFCSDVFYNLAQILPRTAARSILCFAAGMGASFAAVLLRRSPGSQSSTT